MKPRAAAVLAIASAVGCANSASSSRASSGLLGTSDPDPCSGSDPAYVFYSIDADAFPEAACRTVVAQEIAGAVTTGDPDAPAWTSPTTGESLDGTDWIVLRWSDASPSNAGADADAADVAADASAPDVGYVLEFRQGGAEILRVMVVGTIWPVDAASWAELKKSPGAIQGTIVRVPLLGGSIDEGAPLVASAPVSFTIAM